MADFARVLFDKERKLKARHRHIRDAVRDSGKNVGELINDPFGGMPFLLKALLSGGGPEVIDLNKASDLIDIYVDKHQDITGLQKAIIAVLSGYLHIEQAPQEDETEGEGSAPVAPGSDSPATSSEPSN